MKKIILLLMFFFIINNHFFCFSYESFFEQKSIVEKSLDDLFTDNKVIYISECEVKENTSYTQESYLSKNNIHIKISPYNYDIFINNGSIVYAENKKIKKMQENLSLNSLFFFWWNTIDEETNIKITKFNDITMLNYDVINFGNITLLLDQDFNLLQLNYQKNGIQYVHKYSNFLNVDNTNLNIPKKTEIYGNNKIISTTEISKLEILDYEDIFFSQKNIKKYTFIDSIKDFLNTLGGK